MFPFEEEWGTGQVKIQGIRLEDGNFPFGDGREKKSKMGRRGGLPSHHASTSIGREFFLPCPNNSRYRTFRPAWKRVESNGYVIGFVISEQAERRGLLRMALDVITFVITSLFCCSTHFARNDIDSAGTNPTFQVRVSSDATSKLWYMNLNSNVPLCPIWIGRNAPLLKAFPARSVVLGFLRGHVCPFRRSSRTSKPGQALTIF